MNILSKALEISCCDGNIHIASSSYAYLNEGKDIRLISVSPLRILLCPVFFILWLLVLFLLLPGTGSYLRSSSRRQHTLEPPPPPLEQIVIMSSSSLSVRPRLWPCHPLRRSMWSPEEEEELICFSHMTQFLPGLLREARAKVAGRQKEH